MAEAGKWPVTTSWTAPHTPMDSGTLPVFKWIFLRMLVHLPSDLWLEVTPVRQVKINAQ